MNNNELRFFVFYLAFALATTFELENNRILYEDHPDSQLTPSGVFAVPTYSYSIENETTAASISTYSTDSTKEEQVSASSKTNGGSVLISSKDSTQTTSQVNSKSSGSSQGGKISQEIKESNSQSTSQSINPSTSQSTSQLSKISVTGETSSVSTLTSIGGQQTDAQVETFIKEKHQKYHYGHNLIKGKIAYCGCKIYTSQEQCDKLCFDSEESPHCELSPCSWDNGCNDIYKPEVYNQIFDENIKEIGDQVKAKLKNCGLINDQTLCNMVRFEPIISCYWNQNSCQESQGCTSLKQGECGLAYTCYDSEQGCMDCYQKILYNVFYALLFGLLISL